MISSVLLMDFRGRESRGIRQLDSEWLHEIRLDLNIPYFIGPSSYYPSNGSTMTPPPTPSRSAVNGMSQQPSTPYHQQQQQQQSMSVPHQGYPPIFFPVQANVNHFNL